MSAEKILGDWKNKLYKSLYWLEGEEDYYIDLVMNFAALKHVRSEKDTYSILQMLDTNIFKPVKSTTNKFYESCHSLVNYFCFQFLFLLSLIFSSCVSRSGVALLTLDSLTAMPALIQPNLLDKVMTRKITS